MAVSVTVSEAIVRKTCSRARRQPRERRRGFVDLLSGCLGWKWSMKTYTETVMGMPPTAYVRADGFTLDDGQHTGLRVVPTCGVP